MSTLIQDLKHSGVPRPTLWCTARMLPDGPLVYNSHTDELHLLSPLGYYVYQLCDGVRSVDELEDLYGSALGRERLRRFVLALLERDIVEVVPQDA